MKIKFRLLFLLTLITNIAFGQFTTFQVPSTQWALPSFPNNAALYLPKEYKDSVKKVYPILIYFHGRGEAGTNVSTLLSNYILGRINAGWEPQDVNPVTGVTEKFIVLAIQDAGGWSPYPVPMRYAWNYIMNSQKLRIDTNRIYAAGISSGGQCSVMYGCWDSTFAGKLAAVVSMSPAALEPSVVPNLPFFAKYNIPVWFISGDQDGNTNYAKQYTNTIVYAGGDAYTTVYKGGHGGWDPITNGVLTRTVDGKDMNMYQWLLSKSRAPLTVTPPVQTTPPTDTVKVSPVKKVVITVQTTTKFYSDGSVETNTVNF